MWSWRFPRFCIPSFKSQTFFFFFIHSTPSVRRFSLTAIVAYSIDGGSLFVRCARWRRWWNALFSTVCVWDFSVEHCVRAFECDGFHLVIVLCYSIPAAEPQRHEYRRHGRARVQTKATVRVTMSVFFLSAVFTARSMKTFSFIGFVFSLVRNRNGDRLPFACVPFKFSIQFISRRFVIVDNFIRLCKNHSYFDVECDVGTSPAVAYSNRSQHTYVSFFFFVDVVIHIWLGFFLFSNSFSLFSIDDILATMALLTDRLRLSPRDDIPKVRSCYEIQRNFWQKRKTVFFIVVVDARSR